VPFLRRPRDTGPALSAIRQVRPATLPIKNDAGRGRQRMDTFSFFWTLPLPGRNAHAPREPYPQPLPRNVSRSPTELPDFVTRRDAMVSAEIATPKSNTQVVRLRPRHSGTVV